MYISDQALSSEALRALLYEVAGQMLISEKALDAADAVESDVVSSVQALLRKSRDQILGVAGGRTMDNIDRLARAYDAELEAIAKEAQA